MNDNIQENHQSDCQNSLNNHSEKMSYDNNSNNYYPNQNFQKQESEDISQENLKMGLSKNEYGFVEDPRYRQCNKEAMYGVVLGIVNLIIWFVFGYGLGSRPVESYSYIFGLPSWFFLSCIVNSVFIISMTFFVVDKKMVDMSLDTMSMEQANDYVIKNNERLKNKKGGIK